MRASVRRWFGVLLMVAGGLSHADTYEYDEVGNLKTLSSPRGTRTYTYDEVDRLDTETGFTGSRNHAYDVNGNRTTDAASAPGTPTTATYTSHTNRIATINGAAVSLDAAGQITNDGLNSYTWDDAGRLKTVSRAGQLRATYHYDHKHRRTRKVSTAAAPQGAKTIVYHYDDRDRLMAETSDTGVPIRSYAWADENLISQVEYAPNATSTGYDIARILYFELDQLGTPRQARERVGTIVWRWESDGYGTSAANEDPDANGQPTTVNLRFPGQYYDEESGLHYNWHRYYVPRLGRYLSSDPIGIEGGNNTFAYAKQNPLTYTDPTGQAAVAVPALAGLGILICGATNCAKPIGDAMQSVANTLSNGIDTIKEWCSDDEADCDKEWREARRECRQLIFEQLEQRAGRRKRRSVTGVTGGYTDVEECARGLVSERCGGNKVVWK